MTNYIPIPVWDGEKWRPLNFTKPSTSFYGYEEMPWPEGFDPTTIPRPKFNLGWFVQFKRDNGLAIGEIRAIRLHGGCWELGDYCRTYYNNVLDVCKERYFREPDYTIYWNAHGRCVAERNIVHANNS